MNSKALPTASYSDLPIPGSGARRCRFSVGSEIGFPSEIDPARNTLDHDQRARGARPIYRSFNSGRTRSRLQRAEVGPSLLIRIRVRFHEDATVGEYREAHRLIDYFDPLAGFHQVKQLVYRLGCKPYTAVRAEVEDSIRVIGAVDADASVIESDPALAKGIRRPGFTSAELGISSSSISARIAGETCQVGFSSSAAIG